MAHHNHKPMRRIGYITAIFMSFGICAQAQIDFHELSFDYFTNKGNAKTGKVYYSFWQENGPSEKLINYKDSKHVHDLKFTPS